MVSINGNDDVEKRGCTHRGSYQIYPETQGLCRKTGHDFIVDIWAVGDQWEVQGLPLSSFPRLNKLKMVNKLAAYNLCLSPSRACRLLYFLISGMQFLLSQHCFVVKRVKAACSGTTVACPAAQLHLELIMWILTSTSFTCSQPWKEWPPSLSLALSIVHRQAVFGFNSILIYLRPPCWYVYDQRFRESRNVNSQLASLNNSVTSM